MRHKKKFNHLSRKSAHRKAMLANMASSLILHKRIQTTVAKAKALRMYVEPLITKSKEDTTHSRRVVFSYLKDKFAVSELFREVAAKVLNRPGGYTRIIKTGSRLGDNAEMCFIELVDYNEILLGLKQEETAKASTRRSRRSRSKKSVEASGASTQNATETEVVTEEAKVEEPKAETEKVEVAKKPEKPEANKDDDKENKESKE
ncbi:MAG: 50S ribosomal protein L17 [Bacteroidota bacterium]|nr:50S ribosomal protein L17 [Bacteroidota bacterium]